jgi:hypothetical protein
MVGTIAGLAAVLILAALLAVETFGVAIVALAYVTSRERITIAVLGRAGTAVAVSAAAFVAIAALLGRLVPA